MNEITRLQRKNKSYFLSVINFNINVDFFSSFNFIKPDENSKTEYEEEPVIIQKTYEVDLNLLTIHNIIRAKFIHEQKKLKQIKNNIIQLKSINKTNLSPIDLQCNENEINLLTDTYKNIKYGNLWERYIDMSINIIKKYCKIASNKIKGILIIGKDEEDEKIVLDRLLYIEEYLSVIKKLDIITLELYQIKNRSLLCKNCSLPIQIDYKEDVYFCECGCIINSLLFSSDNDPNKILLSNVNESSTPFIKWINNYIGRTNEAFFDILFQEFDIWCINNGFPTGQEVRDKKYTNKFKPNLKFLISLMYHTNNSKHYINKNIIRHLYWGWILPSLEQEMISQALDRYLLTLNEYNKIKVIGKSKINMEVLGFLILRSLGHKCFQNDFKMPSSVETINFINDTWKIICNNTNIPYEKIVQNF